MPSPAGPRSRGSRRSPPTSRTPSAVAAAVRGTAPTHVFFTTWSRRATEAENCDVNGRMLQNLLDATARRELRAPRRARHRAQALSRAVRGVRQGSAGHAVLRGAGAPAVRELLLRPGGHPLRRGRARRLHLVGAPAAHADRLGARQRDEHGRDARRLRGDLPRDRAAASTSRARASSGRRSPTSPTPACSPTTSSGRRRRRPRRTRRSTSSTATSSAGGGCGRGSPPRSASRPSPFDGEPAPLEQQMADAGEIWPRDRAPSRPARPRRRHASPRGGTPMPTSGARSRRSPTWGTSRRLGFLGVRDSESSFTELFARLRAERIVP